jgi:hypothetical protein
MKISRRKFLEMGSAAAISSPFLVTNCSPIGDSADISADLYTSFTDPPGYARPFVRWWWNGDMLTREEIFRELDLLKFAGIGGVEINPIQFPYGGDPAGYQSLVWLSEEWIDILKSTLEAAEERDIICDIIVGSGWPFGGEFLEKDEQTQLMTFETINLEGPGTYSFTRQELLEKVDPAIHSKYEKTYKEITGIRLAGYEMKEFDPGQYLDNKIQDEDITIQVPEGKYVLYYLVKLTGFQAVINGAPGAAGPVLNHYNKTAVEKYLNRMSDGLADTLTNLGDHFRAMFCDSLEMEGANWYDDLPDEFEKRRGYSLLPYLPYVLYKIGHMGNPVEEDYGSKLSPEVELDIQRIRYDFYITRLELFKERFIDTFNEWCHKNDVKSRIQAYGRGYHPLEASELIDIPECETWLRETVGDEFSNEGWRGRAYSVINKFVASGARLSGNNLVSCEEITNTSMVFNATLETIKIAGDQSNLSGVTHSVLHGFNYSPPEAPFPGWVQYGTFFNERNPWWPYLRLWTDYKARLSAVFMQSMPVADIAILHPLADMWMKFGPQRDPFPVVKYPEYQHNVWEAIQQNGFGCDYVSEKILHEAAYNNGTFEYGSRSYSTLILLEADSILPETAKALKKFADIGGKIIFVEKTPHRSPEFKDHQEKDGEVRSICESILNRNTDKVGIHAAPTDNMIEWFKEIQLKYRLRPYMEIANPDKFINQNYYRNGDLDIFFISNSNAHEFREIAVKFSVHGMTPWLWDAESGERKIIPSTDSNGHLNLYFGPSESKLIVFDKFSEGDTLEIAHSTSKGEKLIKGPWTLMLKHVNGQNDKLELNKLVDFLEDDRLKTFAGVIQYEVSVNISEPQDFSYLDLGIVRGISELMVNGKSLGLTWYGFHNYDLKDSLQKGENDIRVIITTVLGNYIKSLEDNPVGQRWTHRQRFKSMGLIGPVKLT